MTWLMRLVATATLCADGATVVALSRDESSASSRTAEEPSAYGVAVDRADDGLFHVDASAGREPVRFVVDTGASVTVMSAGEARLLGGAPLCGHRAAATIETAAGRMAMTWWHLPDLIVAGRRIGAIEVAVVDRGSALLGQDVLARLGSVTIAGGRLTIGSTSATGRSEPGSLQ